MKKKIYNKISRLVGMLAITALFMACDEHRDFPDTAMKPCHILCTDGKVLSVSDFRKSEKKPIAVVFHINHDENTERKLASANRVIRLLVLLLKI